MTLQNWPLRIRLRKGRHVHAAQHMHGDESDWTETKCTHEVTMGSVYLDAGTPVTCPGCLKGITHQEPLAEAA